MREAIIQQKEEKAALKNRIISKDIIVIPLITLLWPCLGFLPSMRFHLSTSLAIMKGFV